MESFTPSWWVSMAVCLALFGWDILMPIERRRKYGFWMIIAAVAVGGIAIGQLVSGESHEQLGQTIITVMLWAAMVAITIAARKGIDTPVSKTPPEFLIQSASWGNGASQVPVKSIIEAMPFNALAFHVNHYALGSDPAPGPGKSLEISCGYPGRQVETMIWKDDEIAVIPPDPQFTKQIASMRSRIEELQSELQEGNTDGSYLAARGGNSVRRKNGYRHEFRPRRTSSFSEVAAGRNSSHSPFFRTRQFCHGLLAIERAVFRSDPSNQNHSRRNVVEVTLRNQSGEPLELWSPLWEHEAEGASLSSPIFSTFLSPSKENGNEEERTLELGRGVSCICQIGLNAPYGDGIERRLQNRTTGTLVVPIKRIGSVKIERKKL